MHSWVIPTTVAVEALDHVSRQIISLAIPRINGSHMKYSTLLIFAWLLTPLASEAFAQTIGGPAFSGVRDADPVNPQR